MPSQFLFPDKALGVRRHALGQVTQAHILRQDPLGGCGIELRQQGISVQGQEIVLPCRLQLHPVALGVQIMLGHGLDVHGEIVDIFLSRPASGQVIPHRQLLGDGCQLFKLGICNVAALLRGGSKFPGGSVQIFQSGTVICHRLIQFSLDPLRVLGAAHHRQRMSAGMSHRLGRRSQPFHSGLLDIQLLPGQPGGEFSAKGPDIRGIADGFIAADQLKQGHAALSGLMQSGSVFIQL